MAPEIVNMKKDEQKAWTSLCDIFSLGVVLFKLYKINIQLGYPMALIVSKAKPLIK